MSDFSENKTLDLYPIDYPFETLVNRMSSSPAKLKLDPDFQRKYKWDNDGSARSSKFIESCLMRIPLPSCYFAEDEEGRHMVIDGVQRLTTIKRFFSDEFQLEGMTTFKELEGKFFSELGALQTELETTTIRCIVLRKENPKSLIREIFSRLNQGAVKLSDQEIRHALYPGSLDELLADLGDIPLIARFGLANKSTVVRNSREAEEQVLRFFAFYDDPDLEAFDTTLKDFLDDYMARHANMDSGEIISRREIFTQALNNCIEVFEDDVFTNLANKGKKKGLVHYDLLMPTLGRLSTSIVVEKKEQIKTAYHSLCNSTEYQRTLSGGLQKRASIMRRNRDWNALLEGVVNAS